MVNTSKIVFDTIASRRTVFPPSYTDEKIEKAILERIIEAATWAPNHGNTEPWRFTVFTGDSRVVLAEFLAKEYKAQFQGDTFNSKKHHNASTWPKLAQALIAVGMKRNSASMIPEKEEARAVSCAVQNMLLMANALGIASYWSTGKLVYSDAMKTYLNLASQDQVIALVYFGYPKEKSKVKKRTNHNQLTHWKDEHKS